jgi:hypothetical protein
LFVGRAETWRFSAARRFGIHRPGRGAFRVPAIEGAQYLKLKNPHAEVTVRDLEGVEETIVIQPQQPQVRR